MLVHLCRNETFADPAAAFDVGAATAHRYVTEVIDLLAELASDLRQAMRIAQRRHGVNIQFLTDPHGELIWASPALPWSTRDLTARPRARHHRRSDGPSDRLLRRQGL